MDILLEVLNDYWFWIFPFLAFFQTILVSNHLNKIKDDKDRKAHIIRRIINYFKYVLTERALPEILVIIIAVALLYILFFKIKFSLLPVIEKYNLQDHFIISCVVYIFVIGMKAFIRKGKNLETKPSYLFSDEETEVLISSLESKKETLKKVINDSDMLSYHSYAINGKWGSGKSSVIKALMEETKDNYIYICINSWKFGNDINIRNLIRKKLIEEFKKHILFVPYRIRRSISTFFGQFDSKLKFIDSLLKENHTSENLNDVIDLVLKISEKDKVIIIFDDIDRMTDKCEIKNCLKTIRQLSDSKKLISISLLDFTRIEKIYEETPNFTQKFFTLIINIEYLTNETVCELIRSDLVIEKFSSLIDSLSPANNKEIISEFISFINSKYIETIFQNPREIILTINEFFLKIRSFDSNGFIILSYFKIKDILLYSLIKIVDPDQYYEIYSEINNNITLKRLFFSKFVDEVDENDLTSKKIFVSKKDSYIRLIEIHELIFGFKILNETGNNPLRYADFSQSTRSSSTSILNNEIFKLYFFEKFHSTIVSNEEMLAHISHFKDIHSIEVLFDSKYSMHWRENELLSFCKDYISGLHLNIGNDFFLKIPLISSAMTFCLSKLNEIKDKSYINYSNLKFIFNIVEYDNSTLKFSSISNKKLTELIMSLFDLNFWDQLLKFIVQNFDNIEDYSAVFRREDNLLSFLFWTPVRGYEAIWEIFFNNILPLFSSTQRSYFSFLYLHSRINIDNYTAYIRDKSNKSSNDKTIFIELIKILDYHSLTIKAVKDYIRLFIAEHPFEWIIELGYNPFEFFDPKYSSNEDYSHIAKYLLEFALQSYNKKTIGVMNKDTSVKNSII